MMDKMKKRLTQSEEFEIMKLVLDKFLWLGVAMMAFGLYELFAVSKAYIGIISFVIGIVVLLLFMWLIVREYEIYR